MKSRYLRALCAAPVLLLGAAHGQNIQGSSPASETIIVTGRRISASGPNDSASVTRADVAKTINTVNTEDMLKYLPDLLVRKRHYGDTQDPITTRTSGVGSSARSLIYADGVLLSSPIGNNNTSASPHWGLAPPNEISRIDVLYGPFSAQYPGNSIGAVVEITTRMPQGFEADAQATGALQGFDQYGVKDTYSTYEASAGIGDRIGNLAWRIGFNHLGTYGQPLSYVTLAQPSAMSNAGVPADGAFADKSRTGTPIEVIGAGGIEHQIENTANLRLTYDFTKALELAYTLAVFDQRDDAGAETFLSNAAGDPVYSGSVNIAGRSYDIAQSAFASGIYDDRQTHYAQGLSLRYDNGGRWNWQAIVTDYDYGRDIQRAPSTAPPTGFAGGPGTITNMNDTGWYTGDIKAGFHAAHNDQLTFGLHYDNDQLGLFKYNTSDWLHASPGAFASASRGKTQTAALWAQNVWQITKSLKLTLGARGESWRAFDGFNYSLAPALAVTQPTLSGSWISPKASLAWQPVEHWTLTASYGKAYRMPTVSELYQAITTGTTLSVPNPHLHPERANSYEVSAQWLIENMRIRLSLFEEDLDNALISQSAPLVAGSTTLYNYVQNVDFVRSRGAELVFERSNAFIRGLSIRGSLTYVDPKIIKDSGFAAAVGKQVPQVPKLRATLQADYSPDERWSFSLAARYSDRVYGTVDNSDTVTHTFTGFDGYFVMDARARYQVNDNWSTAFGIDNLNNRRYFLYHPFPMRSFVLELDYAL